MSKIIAYGEEARKSLQKGIDQLADTVKINPGSKGTATSFWNKNRRHADHQWTVLPRKRVRAGDPI